LFVFLKDAKSVNSLEETKSKYKIEKEDYIKTFSKGIKSKIRYFHPIPNVLPLMKSGMASDQNKLVEVRERPW